MNSLIAYSATNALVGFTMNQRSTKLAWNMRPRVEMWLERSRPKLGFL
jgi:hypothetical protein